MIPLRDLNPRRGTPWVTWGLMLLCGLVYALEVLTPDALQPQLFAQYALVPRRLSALFLGSGDTGAALSVLTSMFLHSGLLHIASNLWFLRIFGDNVEDHFGHTRYAAFYVVSGVGAAVLQWAIDPLSRVPMVGASGAIAGVLAAYLVLYPRARVQAVVPVLFFLHFVELPAFIMIALWFGLQLVSGLLSSGAHGGTAYWAHVGGFVTGLFLTLVLRRSDELPQEPFDVRVLREPDDSPPF